MIDRIVERILNDAVGGGRFDISSRKGTSLSLEDLPFTDRTEQVVFRFLKDAGLRPAWLEIEIEVREKLDKARVDLQEAAESLNQSGAHWDNAVEQFYSRVEEINGLIRRMNLIVPLIKFQRVILEPQKELESVIGDRLNE